MTCATGPCRFGALATAHTGDVIVNTAVAAAVTKVFGKIYARHFPIEAMQATTPAELTAPRPATATTPARLSAGPPAVRPPGRHTPTGRPDRNPFCNPYVKGNLVLPELASAYLDRANYRPGMVFPPDQTGGAFAAIGWSWGGCWNVPIH